MKRSTPAGLVVAILLVNVLLGAGLWFLRPDRAVAWALAMFMLPAAWGVLRLLMPTSRGCDASDSNRVRRALSGAGLFLAVALGLALGVELERIDVAFSERAMGVAMGLVLVIIGNGIPKTLRPLTSLDRASRAQAVHRFAGWAFVIAGIAYAIVWLVAPLAYTSMISTLMVVACLAAVFLRSGRDLAGRPRSEPEGEI